MSTPRLSKWLWVSRDAEVDSWYEFWISRPTLRQPDRMRRIARWSCHHPGRLVCDVSPVHCEIQFRLTLQPGECRKIENPWYEKGASK